MGNTNSGTTTADITALAAEYDELQSSNTTIKFETKAIKEKLATCVVASAPCKTETEQLRQLLNSCNLAKVECEANLGDEWAYEDTYVIGETVHNIVPTGIGNLTNFEMYPHGLTTVHVGIDQTTGVIQFRTGNVEHAPFTLQLTATDRGSGATVSTNAYVEVSRAFLDPTQVFWNGGNVNISVAPYGFLQTTAVGLTENALESVEYSGFDTTKLIIGNNGGTITNLIFDTQEVGAYEITATFNYVDPNIPSTSATLTYIVAENSIRGNLTHDGFFYEDNDKVFLEGEKMNRLPLTNYPAGSRFYTMFKYINDGVVLDENTGRVTGHAVVPGEHSNYVVARLPDNSVAVNGLVISVGGSAVPSGSLSHLFSRKEQQGFFP